MATKISDFKTGEKPEDLVVTFKDSANVVINLTGYSAKVMTRLEKDEAANATESNATITDAPNGEVTYTFGTLSTPGRYLLEVWVGDGTRRYASETYSYTVTTAVGNAPAI